MILLIELNNEQKEAYTVTISPEDMQLIIQKLNELYIMTRHKYLSMYFDKDDLPKWSTIKYSKLTDSTLLKHLSTETTVGVFSGKELTKFICFDIDTPSLEYSKQLYQLLLFTLTEDFNIPLKNIVASFSGKKGYHLEIFFSQALSVLLVESFHKAVLDYINLQTVIYGDIEFRPSYTQGVKLPLSIHKETGNFCNYVDNQTLEAINDPKYILSIEQLDVDVFKTRVLDSMNCSIYDDNFFVLENFKAEQTEELLHEVKPYIKLDENFKEEMVLILEENKLMRNSSRNNTTFNLAIYLKNSGETLIESESIITSVMTNTWENHRGLISKETEYIFMLKEIKRINKYVYSKSYETQNKKSYKLYKEEILKILEIPTKPLRKLMFSLYLQSKKYAKKDGTFYMAYSVIGSMGNCKTPSVVLKHLLLLENTGYIEIVQRNKTNKSMTHELNRGKETNFGKISETNIYKVTLCVENIKESDTYLEVGLDEDITLVDAVLHLLDEKEVKEKLPDKQFYREYKTFYKKANS